MRLTVKQSLKKKLGNQYRYIKEEQTIPWHKEKVQKDKQRSTKHTHKIKILSNTNLTKNWL